MNALSPVFPEASGLFPGHHLPYASPEQQDGYNYLGAGLTLLAGAALAAASREARALRRHAGLALCCVTLMLLSLSSQAYFGRHALWSFQHVPGFIQQFRGTGRLFWPVAYVLLVGSVAVVARLRRPALALLLLVATAGLQVVDAAPLRDQARADLREQAAWTLDPAVLRPLLTHYDLLRLRPVFGCGGDFLRDYGFRELSELASERALPIDTVYAARLVRAPDCSKVGASPLRLGELRVFLPAMTGYAAGVPGNKRFCRTYRGLVFCSLREDDLVTLTAAERRPPSLQLGVRLSAAKGGFPGLLGAGWCDRDPSGTWTCAPRAEVILVIPPEAAPRLIQFWGEGLAPAPGRKQRVTISVRGNVLGSVELPDRRGTNFAVPVPRGLNLRGPIVLEIEIGRPTTPFDLGINGDPRDLGYWLSAVAIE